MTVASIYNDPTISDRPGFRLLRKEKRRQYDEMSLSGLKHAYNRIVAQSQNIKKPSLLQEAEYIHQNIMHIQLCRNVIHPPVSNRR